MEKWKSNQFDVHKLCENKAQLALYSDKMGDTEGIKQQWSYHKSK